MAKITKTWKIGEYAKGGIITVEISGKTISVIGKEWDFSAGGRRSSNQSNAKEFTRETVLSTDANAHRKIDCFLNNLTTCYYSGQILKWIESKMKLNTNPIFW